MFQNATLCSNCFKTVKWSNTNCAQSVNLLQNIEMFENEIKNRQNLKLCVDKGLMFKLPVSNLSLIIYK